MWKKADLQQASYRQIEFDFIDLDDSFKKSVAKYDYPYTDGSDLEDMGLEARTVRVKAVFLPESYGNLSAFIEALKEQGPGEVVHPVFGTFNAIPETVSIRHDERAYFAELDISFIEHLDLKFSVPVSTAGAKLSEATTGSGSTMSAASSSLGASLEDKGIPSGIPTEGLGEPGFMSLIAGYTSTVREVMRDINTVVSTVKAYINEATAPFKLVSSFVSFATDLPGSILSSVSEAIESVAGAYMSLINAPGKFMASLEYGLDKIESALGDFEGDESLEASWHVEKSTALSVAAAIEFAADEATEEGRVLNLKPFGIDAEATRTQLMTIDEIDAVSAIARESINAALAAVRTAYGDTGYDLELGLKRLALIIQQTADTIRLRREKIISYEVPSHMPLHLIAFKLYGDFQEAPRLLRINRIKNPNFISSGTVLKVYA